jgi:hypothetical protein
MNSRGARRCVIRRKWQSCFRIAVTAGGCNLAGRLGRSPKHTSSFSRHAFARGFANSLALPINRGRGGAGVRAAPAVTCATAQETAHLHTGSAESTPTSPTQWFYGVLRALPGERPFLPPSSADTSRRLDARVAAPEPHDLTVRTASLVIRCRPSIASPAQRS